MSYFDPTFPLSIKGCDFWIESANPNSFSLSGSNITQWDDARVDWGISGPGYFASTTSNPQYIPGFQNNRAGTGYSSSYLDISTALVYGSDHTVFAVILSAIGGPRMIAVGGPNGTFFGTDSSSTILWRDETDGGLTLGTPVNLNNMTIISGVRTGGFGELWTNGVGIGSAGFAAANVYNEVALRYIGGSPQGSIGYICEVIIYGHALVDAERRSIEWYLSKKWGIPVV